MHVNNILFKEHPAYKWPTKINPKGIYLIRGKKPEIANGSPFVPHAFVSDVVYQYLPWTYKAWFSGPDTTHIAILVSDEEYTEELRKHTQEIVTYLTGIYGISRDSIVYDAETWEGVELDG